MLPVFYGGGYGTSGGGIGGVLIWVVAAAVLYGVVTSFLDNRKDDAPLLGMGYGCMFCWLGEIGELWLALIAE